VRVVANSHQVSVIRRASAKKAEYRDWIWEPWHAHVWVVVGTDSQSSFVQKKGLMRCRCGRV